MTEREDLERLNVDVLLLRQRSWERADRTRVNWYFVVASTLVLFTGTVFGWYAGKAALAIVKHFR